MRFFNSIGKKVYGIVGLLILSTIVVLIVGTVALHAIDALVALTRAEREHTVNYYQAVSKFEQFIRTGDMALYRQMQDHLRITLGESEAFKNLLDDIRKASIKSVAAELDARFPTVDAAQARNIVIMAKVFPDHPVLKDLVRISRLANQFGGEFLELTQAYASSETPSEKAAALVRMTEINQNLDALPRRFSMGVQQLSGWALSLARNLLIGAFLLFSAVAVAIAARVIRSIARPMKSAVAFSERMAAGDFSGRLFSDSADETGHLIHAINRICRDVGRSLGKIGDTSRAVSEGAEEQSAHTQRTAATLKGITATVKQTASHAGEANKLTQRAITAVKEADGLMEAMTISMGRLSSNSAKVMGIIVTIDQIAFQTNLLALNASVEAARAGDAGQGFAVVAGEVKKLAMRSAEAARNTQELIEGMVKKIDDGTASVENTAEVFEGLTESIRRIGDLIGKIATCSDQQAGEIDGIDQAVSEIERVVKRNAESARELERDIGLFQTSGNKSR